MGRHQNFWKNLVSACAFDPSTLLGIAAPRILSVVEDAE